MLNFNRFVNKFKGLTEMSLNKNYNIFKNLLLYTFVILLGVLIYKLQFIVILFFAAFIIASAIDPLIIVLSKKIPRNIAIILVIIVGLILTALFLVPFVNILMAQTLAFLKEAPVYWEKLDSFISQTNGKGLIGLLNEFGLGKWINYANNIGVLKDMTQLMSFASTLGQNILTGSIDLTKNFLTSIMFIFTMAMLTLFMLIDKNYLKNKTLSYFPLESRERAMEILRIISKKVGGYVISQVIVLSTVFVLVSLGLFLIKVEFALILGVIAAFLELIPVIGIIITTVLIGLVALAQKPILAIFALITYGIIQWLVDNVIRPFVVSKFLKMHPLTFIFSLLAGAFFFGMAGILLAPPAVAAICVLIDELYLNKINIIT